MAPANPELRELVKEMNRSRLAEQFRNGKTEALKAEGEIFPSAILPVMASSKAGNERIFPMKWGFSQRGKTIINARVETAREKPTFREAWLRHRCIIPVSWYYEWEHRENNEPGQKYAIRTEQPGLMMLAGLYRMEAGFPAFVILTRPAHEKLKWMHNRMPVILPDEEVKKWICPGMNPDETVRNCLTDLSWVPAEKNGAENPAGNAVQEISALYGKEVVW